MSRLVSEPLTPARLATARPFRFGWAEPPNGRSGPGYRAICTPGRRVEVGRFVVWTGRVLAVPQPASGRRSCRPLGRCPRTCTLGHTERRDYLIACVELEAVGLIACRLRERVTAEDSSGARQRRSSDLDVGSRATSPNRHCRVSCLGPRIEPDGHRRAGRLMESSVIVW
jgi:hypothetical protein